MSQIVENSVIYNGEEDVLTKSAKKLLDTVVQRFSENEDRLMRIEKAINPLLDDNSQVRNDLTY
jgi:methyltransferase-like protein